MDPATWTRGPSEVPAAELRKVAELAGRRVTVEELLDFYLQLGGGWVGCSRILYHEIFLVVWLWFWTLPVSCVLFCVFLELVFGPIAPPSGEPPPVQIYMRKATLYKRIRGTC